MQKHEFENEPQTLKKKREKAVKLMPELENPESIRTPGRTWTRYPRNIGEELGTLEENKPEIKVEGDVEVFKGSEAVEKAGDKLLDAIKTEENKINALHTAKINALTYIRVNGEAEVHIKYEAATPLFSHTVVETEDSTDLKITEEFKGESKIQTSFTELYVGNNSHVNYGAIESVDTDLSYSRRKAVVGKDSTVKWLNAQFEGELNRTQIETVLKGDNSETEQIGVWYPVEDQHIDISLHAYHVGHNTKCDMDSRAVVDDKARSLYEGLQKVERDAVDTKSFQDQETLMLSDDAEVDASPKLMIENPNVEASHAAAAGTIPSDELHYIESRGIDEEEARRLVVKGYFEPVMQKITLPGLKDKIRKEVARKLEK